MDYVTFCSKFTDWLLRNTGDDVFVSRRALADSVLPVRDTDPGPEEENIPDDAEDMGMTSPHVCYVEQRTREYTARITFRMDDWFSRFGCDWPNAAKELRAVCGRLGLAVTVQPKKAGDYKKDLPEEDRALFDRLRTIRAELARENEVAPYVVFSNRTLYELSVRKPWDKEEMLKIPGVGQKNFSLYGERFLEVIREEESGA